MRLDDRRGVALLVVVFLALSCFQGPAAKAEEATGSRTVRVEQDDPQTIPLGEAAADSTHSLLVALGAAHLDPNARVTVEFRGGDTFRSRKVLHEGDSDLVLQYRPVVKGPVSVVLSREGSARATASAAIPVLLECGRCVWTNATAPRSRPSPMNPGGKPIR